MSELIGDQPVRVVDLGLDQFGRTLGDVYTGDTLLNLAMVHRFAWHFKRYSDDPVLAKAELDATRDRTGLSADPKPVAPWEWGATESARK